jgi:parallel beta-helix repeat protein
MLNPMWVSLSIYGDGDPRFATHDPLFMESLSLTTGDPQYADFVQANFWDKLTAGTYGSSDNLDAPGFGAAVVNGRAAWGIVELSPWDLSATAIAAHLAGEFAIRDALMGAILAGLEATVIPGGCDVIGLAGAIWASAMTGIDLDPVSGIHAGADSTADLASTLAGQTLTDNDGAWLYESDLDPSDPGNADTQGTAFAIAALYAFDSATYIGQIARGVAFIRSLQQTDGQFLCWPGAPLNEAGSVEVNAEAISAIVFVAPPTVYVDDDFAMLGLGDDPAGPGVAVGYDAFGAIQDGVDEVMLGGTVEVAGEDYYMSGLGEYDENVIIYRPVTLVGTSYPAINPSSGAAIMLRSPGGVPLVGVVIDGIDSFSGAYGILLDEDMFAHLGEELDVRDLTISGSPWYFNHTAEGIAILNGTYVSNMLLDDVCMDDNNVGLGISGAGTEVNDLTMLYGSVSYNNNHGLLILSGATVNDLLVLGAEVVGNSNEGVHVNSATLNRAQIDGCLVIDNNGMGLWFQNATVSDLAVLDTLIEGNGESGMALHSGTYSGVLIEGCTFSDNGWEHLDLGLWGGSPTLDDIQIIRNVFDSGAEWAAIYIDGGTSFDPDDVHIHYNAFTLGDWAIGNSSGNTVDASLNWWGDGEGPSTGAPVWGNVIFSPWLGIDPDGNLAAPGVQITGPMLIVVAPVGPKPASGYLNTAIAGANSADLPFTDTIEVRDGVYQGGTPITDSAVVYGLPGAVIDGGWAADAVTVMADGTTIAGFEIRNGNDDGVAVLGADDGVIVLNDIYGNVCGIYLEDAHGNEILSNTLHDNGWYGIQLAHSGNNTIDGNTIYLNDDGIHLLDSHSNDITDNTIYDTPWSGIYLSHGSSDNTIEGNILHDGFAGIVLANATGNFIGSNVIFNHDYGIYLYFGGGTPIVNNNVYSAATGIHIDESYAHAILGNYIQGNDYGIYQTGLSILNQLHGNAIVGNATAGVWNDDVDLAHIIDAALNWWGDVNGPAHADNPAGSGDVVSDNVIYSPWLGIGTDAEPGTAGWQPVSPMLIIVDDVGPVPPAETVLGQVVNTVAGYLNRAIGAANLSLGTDTIEVRHGTYDGSEPITEAVNIVSEPGSALHTTLNGNMSINGNGVLVGLPLQGFRMNGNVTVGAGADAGTSSINWCDLYGSMTNNGTGTFDAQYNYWGTLLASVVDGRTTGAIDYEPFLPKNADDSYVDAAGAFAGAPAGAAINLGGAVGGGGAVEGAISGTYAIGDPIDGRFTLTDPVTGEPVTDAAVTTSLLGPDGGLVFWGCATYDETTGEYVFTIDTSGLSPGTYELIIQTDDGQSKTVSIEVQAA